MGRRSRTDKEDARKERKRIKALVESAFSHFCKNVLYEGQFIKYFRDKGMTKEEADMLWVNAYAKRIIGIEVRPLLRKKRPPKILGHITVFTFKGKGHQS